MGKKRILSLLIGIVVIAAMVIPAVSCSSGSSSATTTSAATTSQTTTKTSTATSTTQATSTGAVVRPAGWSLTLADIPEISNKTPLHIGIIAACAPETMQDMLKKFTDKTGVPVSVEMIGADLMYPKINTELVGRTGSLRYPHRGNRLE